MEYMSEEHLEAAFLKERNILMNLWHYGVMGLQKKLPNHSLMLIVLLGSRRHLIGSLRD